jgi:hypothetical protein
MSNVVGMAAIYALELVRKAVLTMDKFAEAASREDSAMPS